MTVSIIIAVKTWQRNLEECVVKCRELDFDDYEIIILPDKHFSPPLSCASPPLLIIPTGPVGPAAKRDIGARHAHGTILAFLDDDAYPPKDWLTNALANFRDDSIAGLGGPAVTPAHDTLRQKASGRIFSSPVMSGAYVYRYQPRKRRFIDDYPSCNFFIRASVFREAGGFNTDYWPGEDTVFCLEVTKRLGKKLVYAPECLVYHHRRPVFRAHLYQISRYALHRGFFVKKYPETSMRLAYFLPSFLVGFLLFGAFLAVSFPQLRPFYLTGVASYLALVFIFSLCRSLGLIPLVFSGIILSHLTYGIFFLKGLFTRRLRKGMS